jgi:hypothetical protein
MSLAFFHDGAHGFDRDVMMIERPNRRPSEGAIRGQHNASIGTIVSNARM